MDISQAEKDADASDLRIDHGPFAFGTATIPEKFNIDSDLIRHVETTYSMSIADICEGKATAPEPEGEPFESAEPGTIANARLDEAIEFIQTHPELVTKPPTDGVANVAIVIADNRDADGLMCAALGQWMKYDHVWVIPANNRGGWGWTTLDAARRTIERLVGCQLSFDPEAIKLIIADLGATDNEAPAWQLLIEESPVPIHWRDHHDTVDAIRTAVEQAGGEYQYDPTCSAAEIVFENDCPDTVPEKIARAVHLTALVDMGRRNHPDFEAAQAYSWLAFHVAYPLAQRLLAEYGADWVDAHHQADDIEVDIYGRLKQIAAVDNATIEWSLATARIFDIDGYTVVCAFGDAYQTGLGYAAIDRLDADLMANVKSTGKISLRGHDDGPDIGPIAKALGGGGRDNTGGANAPDLDGDAYPDRETHIATRGGYCFAQVLAAIQQSLGSN